MAVKRDIKPNAAGGWDVLKTGDRRAAVSATTKQAALSRASALVRREGGGEVRVINSAGKVVQAKAVSATRDSVRRAAAA